MNNLICLYLKRKDILFFKIKKNFHLNFFINRKNYNFAFFIFVKFLIYMKKYFVILALAAPMFWQCTSGPSRTELSQMNNALLWESAQKDAQLNQLIESISSIEENLRIIKDKENIISIKVDKGDIGGNSKDQINEDINLIYNLMVENKNRIEKLEKQLKNAGVEKGKLNKLIEGLTLELQAKNEEIAQLNQMLLDKDFQIGQLSKTVGDLSVSLETMRELNQLTQEELQASQDLYHTAYYAMGTKKELRDRKITDKQGFLFFGEKKVLPEGFDKQYFNTIDVRNTKSISISGKKVKLLTRHPEKSYKLVNGQDGNITLNILDIDMFWSINKYLVVQIN